MMVRGVTALFFLVPCVLFVAIKLSYGAAVNIPPSTQHHRLKQGAFVPPLVRGIVLAFLLLFFFYALVICAVAVRRRGVFPFKVRPLLLVWASTLWSLFMLAWLGSRWLSDWVPMGHGDGAAGDGLAPPCWLSQVYVGIGSIGLYTPYILRAWQLAAIFRADDHAVARREARTAGRYQASAAHLDDDDDEPHLPHPHPQQQQHEPHAQDADGSFASDRSFNRSMGGSFTGRSLGHGGGFSFNEGSARPLAGLTSADAFSSMPHTRSPSLHFLAGTPPPPSSFVDIGADAGRAHGRQGSSSHNDGGASLGDSASLSLDFAAGDSSGGSMHRSSIRSSPFRRRLLVCCGRCIDNLTDRKLYVIYLLVLLPFAVLTFASFNLPSSNPLNFLTSFECTDEGPANELARGVWLAFAAVAIVAFVLGMASQPANLWDGFSIRRELAWAVGFEIGVLALVLLSMATRAASQRNIAGIRTFNQFLGATNELLLWIRSMLLFYITMAQPLVESFDINAMPLTKARLHVQRTPRVVDSSAARTAAGRSASLLVPPSSRVRSSGGAQQGHGSGFSTPRVPISLASSRRNSHDQQAGLFVRPSSFSVSNSLLTQSLLSEASTQTPLSGTGGNGATDPPSSASSRLQLSSVISHSEYFSYFASFCAADEQMLMLWTFYVSLSLFASCVDAHAEAATDGGRMAAAAATTARSSGSRPSAGGGGASEDEQPFDVLQDDPREEARRIFHTYFTAATLRGSAPFSQWLLLMANVLQQEAEAMPLLAMGSLVASASSAAAAVQARRPLSEHEAAQALERVDALLRSIAHTLFMEDESFAATHTVHHTKAAPFDQFAPSVSFSSAPSVPRDLFEPFSRAALVIMELWFWPRFLRSPAYTRMLRDFKRSADIQARIDRAHDS
jgi:hypothetical protein